MIEDIFIDEYKNIKEVDLKDINDTIIDINHSLCETKKGLKCAKKIKRVQLKYRVFKRKKHNYSALSNMIVNEYSKKLARITDSKLTIKDRDEAIEDADIYQFELALINDESREYEYNKELDTCIKVFKNDIKGLKRRKRKLVLESIKTQIDNLKVIKKIDDIDKDLPVSKNRDRVLRRFLR